MKRFLPLVALLLATGCYPGWDATPKPNTIITNSTSAGNVTNNTGRAEWYPGIVIILRRVPDARTIEALGNAGASPAKPDSSLIWNLPHYDRENQDQIHALTRAQEFGLRTEPLRQ